VDGERIEADAMIVALGAALDTEKIPGFAKYALNPYDPASLEASRETLENFKGGRVVVGIFGMPIKCPPAPYEITLLLDDWFKARGVSAEMTAFTPLPMSIPILGQSGCEGIEGRLSAKRIPLLTHHQATAVEPDAVVFGDRRVPFDLLLGIPQHRVPDVIVESGLAQSGGWIMPDPLTLETKFPGVYAVGDSTAVFMANGQPLPKAGVFAQGEAEVAAERIAAILKGETPTATYSGEGGCFLEVGGGKAMMVAGQFLAQPAPIVNLTDATEAQMEEKNIFESSHLQTWFGG
jgi:sulfide:quinone oxidoreductase